MEEALLWLVVDKHDGVAWKVASTNAESSKKQEAVLMGNLKSLREELVDIHLSRESY